MKDRLVFTLDEGARLPTRTYPGDAGFDLMTNADHIVPGNGFADISCGVRVAFPPGYWGRVTGRSSTLRKWGLLAIDGVIDGGFRGELFSAVWNMTDQRVFVPAGTRLTQLIIHGNMAIGFEPIEVGFDTFDRIPGDGRGTLGFGSSGT